MHQNGPSVPQGSGRRLYTTAAVVASLIVFAGFARSYYLKTVFGTPELPLLRHVHGLVMTLWFALFVLQTQLVAMRRIYVHRRLGVAGALLAIVVFIVGVATAIAGARRGAAPPGGPTPLAFLAVPLGDMFVFAALVGTGAEDPDTVLLYENWIDRDNFLSVQLKRPYRDRYEARLPELLRSPRNLSFLEPIRSVP